MGIYQTRCIRVTGISLSRCLHYLDHQIGCCTGRAAARKWPVVVTVAWSRGLDRDTAALRSGSDPASGRPGSSCSLAVGGTDWWQAAGGPGLSVCQCHVDSELECPCDRMWLLPVPARGRDRTQGCKQCGPHWPWLSGDRRRAVPVTVPGPWRSQSAQSVIPTGSP